MAREYPHGEGIVKWISPQWLGDRLPSGDLLVLDVQPNVHDYFQQHIPDAVYMNEGLLRVPQRGLPAQYIPAQAFEWIARRVGIDNDRPVVVYTGKGAHKGWGDGLEQTMMAYTLTRFGHNQVYVLDGGLERWIAEGQPVSQAYPELTESHFAADVQQDYFVPYDTFKTMKDRDSVRLLDARPKEVYEGQGPWSKPGHIPGAINFPWKRLMDESNPRLLKSDKEIQAMLDEQRLEPSQTIICSCGTGREATNEFLLFKWYLGFPKVKIYEGSFTEWCAYPENPTVTGPSPR